MNPNEILAKIIQLEEEFLETNSSENKERILLEINRLEKMNEKQN